MFRQVSHLSKYLIRLIILFFTFISMNISAAGLMNSQAPDFTLKSLSGENLNLTEQRGKITIINFWASWCGPCRKEMPVLQGFHDKYKKLGVQVWGVNVEQNNQAGRDFLSTTKVEFPIFFDIKNTISADYQVDAMPTTVVIDRDGRVRHVFRGYKDGYEKKYAKAIKKLIRE